MKNNFDYLIPKDVQNASALSSPKEATIYAGGTDVLGLIKNGLFFPKTLVNINNINQLKEVTTLPDNRLSLGSAVKISSLANNPIIGKKWPLLAAAAKHVASPQLRNMATLGGNLCQRPRCWYFRGPYPCLRKGGDTCFAVDGENKYHCITGGDGCYIVHPSDLAVALRAMNASLEIYKDDKSITVTLDRFFVLPEVDDSKENILESGQVISRVIIPQMEDNTKYFYYKHRERGSWDFAIVSLAAMAQLSGSRVVSTNFVFGGVAPIPWVEEELNKRISGVELNERNIEKLSTFAFKSADPLEKNAYKITLAQNLVKKALRSFAGIN